MDMTELIIIVSRFPPTPAAGFCNALNVHRSAVFSCLCSDWRHWHTDVKKYEAKKKVTLSSLTAGALLKLVSTATWLRGTSCGSSII